MADSNNPRAKLDAALANSGLATRLETAAAAYLTVGVTKLADSAADKAITGLDAIADAVFSPAQGAGATETASTTAE